MSATSRLEANPYLHPGTKQADFLRSGLEKPERLLGFLKKGKRAQETLPHSYFRLAVASRISDDLVKTASSENAEDARTAFNWLNALTGPIPEINSANPSERNSFLLHEGIVEVRLATVETLLPVFSALASNPNLQDDDLKRVQEILRPLMGYELFPNYFGSEAIPHQDGQHRFSLGERIIDLYGRIAKHPNAQYFSLENAMIETISVATYSPFDRVEKTKLLKQAIPVSIEAAVHPPEYDLNTNRSQLLLTWLGLIYRKERDGYMAEKLTKENKLDLADDVIGAIGQLIKNEKPLGQQTVLQVLNTLKTVVFYDEFSPEERVKLLLGALPLMKDLFQKHPDLYDLQDAFHGLFYINFETNSRYVFPRDVDNGALAKAGNGEIPRIIGSLAESDPLREELIDRAKEIVVLLDTEMGKRRFGLVTVRLAQAYNLLANKYEES